MAAKIQKFCFPEIRLEFILNNDVLSVYSLNGEMKNLMRVIKMTDICHFFRVQYNFAEQINTYKYNYDDFQK